MILTALLFGAAIITGTTLVATFWNDITDWLKKAVDKVKQVVKAVVFGFKVFIKKTGEAFKEISKHYSKKGTQWEETTVTRTIDESEVPPEILEKVKQYETDLTEDYEEALELEVS